MTMPAESKRRYTIAEYLAMEEAAVDRHEFHDGEILAMSGGTAKHSLIVVNILVALRQHLKGGAERCPECGSARFASGG